MGQEETMDRPILYIQWDLDGVWFDAPKDYPRLGPENPDALETLKWCHDRGHKQMLATARPLRLASNGLVEVIADDIQCKDYAKYVEHVRVACFLNERGYNRYIEVCNENFPELIAKWGDCRKLTGNPRFDDENAGGFPGFEYARRIIMAKEDELMGITPKGFRRLITIGDVIKKSWCWTNQVL